MYIEDIVDKIIGIGSWLYQGTITFSSYDSKFLYSIDSQLCLGRGLTEKQNILLLKILTKYQSDISKFLSVDVNPFLTTPRYKYPIRTLSQQRTIKIVDDAEGKNKTIQVSFPYDESLVNQIKEYRKNQTSNSRLRLGWSTNAGIVWNTTTTTWDFLLQEDHLSWLHKTFEPAGFQFEDTLKKYIEEIKSIEENVENYVPMIIFEENKFKYINTHKNIPQPTSTDLLEVLFESKKNGISIWDTSIDIALDDISINDCTRQYLKIQNSQEITFDNKIFNLTDLEEIIHNIGRCVFVIPGGTEHDTLTRAHKFLQNSRISEEEITVMFRLDSSAGAMCNHYIKENKLNTPLTDKTKFIFVSSRVPKPLISAKLPIDCIINFGSNNAHYTLKNLLKFHHCIINYTMLKLD